MENKELVGRIFDSKQHGTIKIVSYQAHSDSFTINFKNTFSEMSAAELKEDIGITEDEPKD